MSHATTTHLRRASGPRPDAPESSAPKKRSRLGPWALFLVVFAAQFAFGMYMGAEKGFLWFDAVNRSFTALMVLYSTDPHLAAIGFVWMPLPSFAQLPWMLLYPLWPGVLTTGFAATLTSALAGGATAALLLFTSRKLGLPDGLGWAFALLVSLNPMIFLYGANGMSEGIAAPFLVGVVAFLTLYWRTGKRRYVVASGFALALAFACLYQAVQYGAVAFLALVLGLVWRSGENAGYAPQGRLRAVQGLGLVLLVPSFYVAALWVGANWAILGDPLYFAHSQYSNVGHVTAANAAGSSKVSGFGGVTGDVFGTLRFIAVRTVPFLLPGAFLLVVRALDGRFWRANTLSLFLLLVVPNFAFNAPVIYDGTSFGWLRYFMYPLFVAAGWGLFEVYRSRRRRLAAGLTLAGWILAAPVVLLTMLDYDLGRQEAAELRAVVNGARSEEVVFYNIIGEAAPVPAYLNEEIFPKGHKVALDSFNGWGIASLVPFEAFRQQLILTPDRNFSDALAEPQDHDVGYFLVSDPVRTPGDAILEKYPKMWDGQDPAFRLVKTFPAEGQRQEWRLFEFLPPGSEEFDRNLERIDDEAR